VDVVVAGSPEELAREAARRLVAACQEALAARGRAVLALSGGSSPAGMFTELARSGLDWARIDVFQVDERVAPDGHPDRNALLLRSHLLDAAAVPENKAHLMPVTADDLEEASAAYAGELHRVTGDGVLDAIHLGLGPDGHTASWPPGDPVADLVEGPDVVVVGPFNGRLRMTLTPPAVNRARSIVWLVDGADRRPVTTALVAGDPSIPASRVRRSASVLVAGSEAAPVSWLAPEG
jgi:6-phosphogluconolactonase